MKSLVLVLLINLLFIPSSFPFVPIPSTASKRSLNSNMSNKNIAVPSEETLSLILATAEEAARKAGNIILANSQGAEVTKTKANSKDLLTLIDPMCEAAIKETVLKQFPNHGFLGEEDVPPGKDASAKALEEKLKSSEMDHDGFCWIVDPIDGTSNFVHGMPLCMPSIACAYYGTVIVGVIYDPHRDELFSAVKNQGATMNSKPIRVGQQEVIGDAIVAMGSPPAEESLKMSLLGIKALMPKVRTIRMLGSAALMLAWVANGRLTCYWEYDLSSWDIAAGALLVQEAGGRFSSLNNDDFNLSERRICASNGKVHDSVIETLKEAGVE